MVCRKAKIIEEKLACYLLKTAFWIQRYWMPWQEMACFDICVTCVIGPRKNFVDWVAQKFYCIYFKKSLCCLAGLAWYNSTLCTAVLFWPLNFAIFLCCQKRWNKEKIQKSRKYLVRSWIEQMTAQTVKNYAFFSARYLLFRFTFLFLLRRRSSFPWCRSRETRCESRPTQFVAVRVN